MSAGTSLAQAVHTPYAPGAKLLLFCLLCLLSCEGGAMARKRGWGGDFSAPPLFPSMSNIKGNVRKNQWWVPIRNCNFSKGATLANR